MLIEIDAPTREVAAQILAVQVAAYRIESVLIDYPELPPLYESVDDILTTPERFLLYLDGEQIAGVLSYERVGDTLAIGRLVVSPAHFRRGIASQLLTFLERLDPICHTIIVSTADANTPAIRLYQKHGYQIFERRTLADGLKLVRLKKDCA